ncbi:CYTH and CHAD domain-containing protein [Kineosporia sp. NBRC 101731]|uniref:CYTH and CHAD domain-containing protein n=1 Tax=Kineosporia sp. NBRC 101731 TaxID=3032199 RepID=UPI00249FDC8F|nr:CYTH and CHAD domain-containing protein [Kineosporia sp. NBRC 101731]GLY33917.1 CHAD domain-containing protein [Kineosporia sp. NBRC 101731]
MVAATHTEIEIKLDADPEFALPDLSALPGVASVGPADEHRLQATYLDSEDFRLIRGGTTLRRRTGGNDAGWHLKLKQPIKGSAADSRLEIHEPLGRGVRTVPASLLGLVRVQLRGAQVSPVALISTTRTVRNLLAKDGTVLAEVADDLVSAHSLGHETTAVSWREIEVELVDGDLELLTVARELLLANGARPSDVQSKIGRALAGRLLTAEPAELEADGLDGVVETVDDLLIEPLPPKKGGKKKGGPALRTVRVEQPRETVVVAPVAAGDVAQDYLTEQFAQLVALDPRVRLDKDDAVHQMRVATRRLRTALATFRPFFAPDAVTSLREELKWLGSDVLGPVRDAEVIREKLLADVAALPAELVLGPVARRIQLEMGAEYRSAHESAVAELDGDRYLALIDELEAFVAAPPFSVRASNPAADELRKVVRKAAGRVSQHVDVLAGETVGSPEHDFHLHEVRIKAKRARYATEAARPVIGKPAKQVAKGMESITETLGNHQDGVVQRQWLRDLGVRAHGAGENGFTFGLLHGRIAAAAEHDENLFTAAWDQTRAALAVWPG